MSCTSWHCSLNSPIDFGMSMNSSRVMALIAKLAVIMCWTVSLQVVAAEQAEPQPAIGIQQALDAPQSAVPQVADEANVLDEPHDYLAKKFVGMVGDIDRFFGTDRDYQESNQSVLQLDLTRVSGYSGNNKLVLSGRAKLSLPSTEKHLHLLFETDPDKNPNGEPPPVQATPLTNVAAPSSYAAALRYEKSQEGRWFFSTDAGVKFHGLSSNLFTRARASYSVPLEQWSMKFTESPFWFNTLGAGVSSQLDVERVISEPVLFRASSNATWLNDTQNFDLRQDVSIYHTLDERRALLYQVSAIGASQPQYHAADYALLVLYRYRLHQQWMFLEVSPQLHYPQIRNYQASPMLSLRLEVLFDRGK